VPTANASLTGQIQFGVYGYKRGKTWWYAFQFGGRRIQESSRCTNKHKAQQLEAKRKTELIEGHAGIRRKAPTPRFEEAVQLFLEWSRCKHRPKTYELHKMNCSTLRRYFGGKWLDQITPEMVDQFRLMRLRDERRNAHDGSTVSPASVNRALATLRLIFNRLELRSPTRREMFFREDGQTRVVSVQEELAYLREASQPLRDIATIIVQTGMRPEEVFRMEIRNVDLAHRIIFNPFGKTKAAKRKIPMTTEVCDILHRRLKEAKGRWVFCSPSRPGQPEQPDRAIRSVRKAHDAAVRRAGIRDHFRLYDLRHSYATRAAQAGVDLLTLAALLGHTTVQMTSRYVHPTDQHKVEAARKLEEYNAEGRFRLAGSVSGSLQNPLQ
jgi:integrase